MKVLRVITRVMVMALVIFTLSLGTAIVLSWWLPLEVQRLRTAESTVFVFAVITGIVITCQRILSYFSERALRRNSQNVHR